jgi:hypothetical protein
MIWEWHCLDHHFVLAVRTSWKTGTQLLLRGLDLFAHSYKCQTDYDWHGNPRNRLQTNAPDSSMGIQAPLIPKANAGFGAKSRRMRSPITYSVNLMNSEMAWKVCLKGIFDHVTHRWFSRSFTVIFCTEHVGTHYSFVVKQVGAPSLHRPFFLSVTSVGR